MAKQNRGQAMRYLVKYYGEAVEAFGEKEIVDKLILKLYGCDEELFTLRGTGE